LTKSGRVHDRTYAVAEALEAVDPWSGLHEVKAVDLTIDEVPQRGMNYWKGSTNCSRRITMKQEREIRRAYNLLLDDMTEMPPHAKERDMLMFMSAALAWALEQNGNPVAEAMGAKIDQRLAWRAAKNN